MERILLSLPRQLTALAAIFTLSRLKRKCHNCWAICSDLPATPASSLNTTWVKTKAKYVPWFSSCVIFDHFSLITNPLLLLSYLMRTKSWTSLKIIYLYLSVNSYFITYDKSTNKLFSKWFPYQVRECRSTKCFWTLKRQSIDIWIKPFTDSFNCEKRWLDWTIVKTCSSDFTVCHSRIESVTENENSILVTFSRT